MKYQNTWDLEAIFAGGTRSEDLQKKVKSVEVEVGEFKDLLDAWNPEDNSPEPLKALLDKLDSIEKGLIQGYAFVRMSLDANTKDDYGPVVLGQIMMIKTALDNYQTVFTKKMVAVEDRLWADLLEDPTLKEVAFALNEARDQGKRLLSEEEEKIINELNRDGITGWSQIYDTVVSTMTIPFTGKDGTTVEYSVGQAMNRMYGDPDPEVRRQLFENWEKAWEKNAPIFADILNHLSGYRLTLQKLHNREHYLEEPLEINRMSKETLDAMWSAVAKSKEPFIRFLEQKAKVLGMDKLGWQDVDAPIAFGGVEPSRYDYDEACDFVLQNFATFGPKLEAFARNALENRWVEAEDRPNKRPGGYCMGLPELKESRIFMTYTGSSSDVSTLAHELGHAFHSYVLKDAPFLNQNYAMNVAETASTFAELIVSDATVRAAKSREEKAILLNTKMENAIAMFMNIHARFLFETAFYDERVQGVVSTKRISELMENAQKEAYCDMLGSYHPHFWCSKLHFYIAGVPFYNFPYTFGFLFSLGLYAEYLKNPEGFEDKYIALLQDTGKMKVEDLAAKHLGVDLTKEDFWLNGINLLEKDVEEFIELTK